jgi:hypothetical protein
MWNGVIAPCILKPPHQAEVNDLYVTNELVLVNHIFKNWTALAHK